MKAMVEAKEDFNKLLAFTGFECDAQNPPPFTTSDSRQEKRSRARAEPVPIQPKSKVRDRAIETDRDRPLCNEFSAVHPVDRDHTCQQTSRIDAIFLNGMLSERIIKVRHKTDEVIHPSRKGDVETNQLLGSIRPRIVKTEQDGTPRTEHRWMRDRRSPSSSTAEALSTIYRHRKLPHRVKKLHGMPPTLA